MNCSIPDCPNIAERSGKCATHSRLERKAEKQALQPVKAKKSIAKVGKNNTFECSDGTRVTQEEVNAKLTASYSIKYTKSNSLTCEGCGGEATCSAHIIAKSRCKSLGKTELIWEENNYFPSCFDCNAAIENPKGQEWKKLKNVERCMKFIAQHDPELFTKFHLYASLNEQQPTGEIKGLGEMFRKLIYEPHKI